MKKIILTLLILLCLAVAVSKVNADEVVGWLWGGSEDGGFGVDGSIDGDETGIGWISANRLNCDADGDGFSDGTLANCPPAGTPMANYGLDIPTADGDVTGYAWSENIGWINFDPVGDFIRYPGCGFPETPCGDVQRSGNNLVGWARIVGIQDELAVGNSGGWEGWIKMSGTASDGSPFGISVDPVSGNLLGYAYAGGDELGWVKVIDAKVDIAKTLKICRNSCDSGLLVADTSGVSSLSMLETDPVVTLVACYNSDSGCGAAATDDTSSTVWDDNESPDNAVNLGASPANSTNMTPNAAAGVYSERVSATFSGQTVSFDVSVLEVCSYANCVGNVCTAGASTATGSSCPHSDDCTFIPDSCAAPSGGTGWKETAP